MLYNSCTVFCNQEKNSIKVTDNVESIIITSKIISGQCNLSKFKNVCRYQGKIFINIRVYRAISSADHRMDESVKKLHVVLSVYILTIFISRKPDKLFILLLLCLPFIYNVYIIGFQILSVLDKGKFRKSVLYACNL